ncbi:MULTISPECIES: hypothetical protein [unclassified Streptomyces]|nr:MULTISPECIES: hypothetical protein [unclassified Streptomyces]WSE00868.1 hypothetical protein OG758_45955 [Streptomyces sp. NBC_01474]
MGADNLGGAVETGGRNYLAADLDGDGVTDPVLLNFDDTSVDRTAS